MKVGLLTLALNLGVFTMLNFKKNWDLIGLFLMLCFIVLYLAGDLIIHARTAPDLRGKIFDQNGNIILCTNGNKSFAPQGGMCIE